MDEIEDEELWSRIEGFDIYIISNLGNVRHIDKTFDRKINVNAQGFPCVVLFGGGTKIRYVRQVNKLVANAFCPPPEYKDETNIWHIDGNVLNLRWDNLKWERRDRTLEWNEMNRLNRPKFNTPKVISKATGTIFENAFECAMVEGVLESSVIKHIERYPEEYADNARWRYV